MLANLRRKVGLPTSGMNTPMQHMLAPSSEPIVLPNPPVGDPSNITQPFTMEELGFAWSANSVSPAEIPLWLQEQVSLHARACAWTCRAIVAPSLTLHHVRLQSLTDLGLPVNGSDGIFMNLNQMSGWPGVFAPIPEAR